MKKLEVKIELVNDIYNVKVVKQTHYGHGFGSDDGLWFRTSEGFMLHSCGVVPLCSISLGAFYPVHKEEYKINDTATVPFNNLTRTYMIWLQTAIDEYNKKFSE